MTAPASPHIARARESYACRAWSDAFDSFSAADAISSLGLDDLECLALAAGLIGRDDDLLRLMERLYQAHADVGRCGDAARWAFWLGFRLMGLGEPGRASGWFTRAERFAERDGKESVVHGYLLLPTSHRHLSVGDFEASRDAAIRAAEIGERFGDVDLSTFARSLEGRALLRQGQIERGLALLDEAMLSATSGQLSPTVAGLVYCMVIANCHRVYALNRAREWTAALAAWCDAQPQLVTFTGTCIAHRAEILQLGGAWQEATLEARRASARLPCASSSRRCNEPTSSPGSEVEAMSKDRTWTGSSQRRCGEIAARLRLPPVDTRMAAIVCVSIDSSRGR